jgi:hypothetical protein
LMLQNDVAHLKKNLSIGLTVLVLICTPKFYSSHSVVAKISELVEMYACFGLINAAVRRNEAAIQISYCCI